MDKEIITTRTINASQALVFKAWTDPEHLKNWWGPHGFTNTFHVFNLQPGGKWSFIMHGPNGDYENESVFVHINEPDHLVFDHISLPQFQVDVVFKKIDHDFTKVIWRMIFPSHEHMMKLKSFVQEKNEENMDRLEKEIQRMK